MNTFEKKDFQEEVRSALSREGALERREQRDLKRAEATGRVTSFLRNRANSDEVLRASLALTEANNSAQFAQATVQYQRAIETKRTSDSPKIEQSQPDPQTILPPRPNDDEIYTLCVEDTELKWLQTSVTTSPHPWQIVLKTEGNGPTEFKVELNSKLYSGLESWNDIEVNGLNEWNAANVGYIVLFGVIENGICTEASIEGPQGIPSDRIDFVEDEQNSFSTILGYIYDDGDGNLLVKQETFHNLTLINCCVNGIPAIYPFAT